MSEKENNSEIPDPSLPIEIPGDVVSPPVQEEEQDPRIPTTRPESLTPEMEAEILTTVSIETRVENGETIEEFQMPVDLFEHHENVSSCCVRYAIHNSNPTDHRLDFLKGFSPMCPLYPMKLIRNVDQDTFEIVKLPENEVWTRGSWSKLQNPNQNP